MTIGYIGHLVRASWGPLTTEKKDFLSPDHQKQNSPQNTKNPYFLSQEHQKSILSVTGPSKVNIFCP